MLHKAVKLLAVLCVSQAFIARPQQASPPAALESTTKWLTDKLSDTAIDYRYDDVFPDGSVGKCRSTLKQTLATNGCQGLLVIHQHSEICRPRSSEWQENEDHDLITVRFHARKLLPASAKLSRWDETWKEQQTSTPTVYLFHIPGYVESVLTDPDLAPRIQKAVTGWGRLCGAEDEPY